MAMAGLHLPAATAAATATAFAPPSLNVTSTRIFCASRVQDEIGPLVSRREGIAGALSAVGLFSTFQSAGAAEELKTVDSGLGYYDIRVGTGPPAVMKSYVKVNYTTMFEDGTELENSYILHRPITFRLGIGQVIDGWDQGILGGNGIPPMLQGGKRRLQVPASLAFGEEGIGCKKRKSLIKLVRRYLNQWKAKDTQQQQEQQQDPPKSPCYVPPNATLLFDVELMEVTVLPKDITEVRKL